MLVNAPQAALATSSCPLGQVHTVPAAARRAPFEIAQLTNQARIIQQADPAAIQGGQEFGIDRRFVAIRNVIGNAARFEPFAGQRPA
jgi:hypothetical protein